MLITFFGCGLVMSDGLLTPTTSVLSAIDGISVATNGRLDFAVLPISCGVLVILFLMQHSGSGTISIVFAPIALLWLLSQLITGVINCVRYPEIFKALNPKFAVDFAREFGGFDRLGSVMLAVTGCEAIFADAGHYGRRSIQLALICFVYPCLFLAYFGQCAYITLYPKDTPDVFYLSVPGGINTPQYWIIFVLATLATIIASQALILGVFSILRQMIYFDCFPAFKVVHTSSKIFGQVYLPTVNYVLMVGVILACIRYQNNSAVTAPYGLGISMDFFVRRHC
ncbi:potassium transporter [Dipodascopsis uninucleata]